MTHNSSRNVAISHETHLLLVAYTQETGGKIGRFVDKAIKEKIEREKERPRKREKSLPSG